MDDQLNIGRPTLVQTIKERCRVCYTCVRECPAKAIRIRGGQAEVIGERCIGCGNCFLVCSQNAKRVLNSIEEAKLLLTSENRVAACIAPSFPAEFLDLDYRRLVGMVRALGFDLVNEVAFGADLVAKSYGRLLQEHNQNRYIAANCPAIIEYVQRYHPDLVRFLAPIVSPMVATARFLHKMHGPELKIVFIGPCIAKKGEKDQESVSGEVDAALTFPELRRMFEERDIEPERVPPSEFDPPHSGMGALFPVSRGMLQAAKISDDLLPGDVLAADGKINFVESIKEFENGSLNVRLLEVLCCNGCIMGPGIQSRLPLFSRRSMVINYVRECREKFKLEDWNAWMAEFESLDLSRAFAADDQRIHAPDREELKAILNRMGKFTPEDELNCGACGYETCLEHAIAIAGGLAESEMCLPYAIDQLKKTVGELAEVQAALVQSEKLASMGQLAAGIAHEINNPLGVALMYAHLLLDECERGSPSRADLEMIVEQTDRCKGIVAGLLNFARQNKLVRRPVDLVELIERSLHSLPVPANVTVEIEPRIANPVADVDGEQIAQVLTNLIGNAYAAMPDGGSLTLGVSGDQVRISIVVADTGAGIAPENYGKIFEPFFTTKQMDKGTGLGLAVTYGIVKMHRGEITFESNSDPGQGPTGTTFTVTLPRSDPGDQ